MTSVVALFLALGLGTAYALEKNSVRSTHIVNGEVKGKDLATDAVPANGTGSEGSSKLATDSVDFNEVATNAIGSVQLRTGSVGADEVDESDVPGIAQTVTATKTGTGRTSALVSNGPLSVEGSCSRSTTGFRAELFAESSTDNAAFSASGPNVTSTWTFGPNHANTPILYQPDSEPRGATFQMISAAGHVLAGQATLRSTATGCEFFVSVHRN